MTWVAMSARETRDRIAELRETATATTMMHVEGGDAITRYLRTLGDLHAALAALTVETASTADTAPMARQIEDELYFVDRVMFRAKNQHRRSQNFQKLHGCSKRFRALLHATPPHTALTAFAAAAQAADQAARSAGAVSARQLRKIGVPAPEAARASLMSLRLMAELAEMTREICERSFEASSALLSQTFFMPFALVGASASARLWAFATHAERLIRASYDAVHGLCSVAGAALAPALQGMPLPFADGKAVVAAAVISEKSPITVNRGEDTGEALDVVTAAVIRTKLPKPATAAPPPPKPRPPPPLRVRGAPASVPTKPTSADDIFATLFPGSKPKTPEPPPTKRKKG
jgi:hypothetical protein